jgi:hypothetical protein
MVSVRSWLKRGSQATVSAKSAGSVPVMYVLSPDGSLQGVKLTGDALELLVGNVVQRGEGLQPDEYGYASAYLASEWAFRCLNVRAARTAELLYDLQVVERDTGKAWPEHPFLQAVERAYTRYHQDYYFQYVIQLDTFGEQYTEKIAGTSPYLGPVRLPWGIRVLPSLAVEPEIVGGEIRRFVYYGEDRAVFFEPDQVAYDYTFNPSTPCAGCRCWPGRSMRSTWICTSSGTTWPTSRTGCARRWSSPPSRARPSTRTPSR